MTLSMSTAGTQAGARTGAPATTWATSATGSVEAASVVSTTIRWWWTEIASGWRAPA